MKLTKSTKSVKASKNVTMEDIRASVYASSEKSIKAAIDSLGSIAKKYNDAKAKEVIANLSVVLLDMKQK